MAYLYITSECNNDCEYCCSKHLRGKKQFFPYEEIENFIDWLDYDVVKNNIFITGGEPTLHPDLKKILRKCSFFTKTILMTNLLCSKELVKDLLEINYITWNISTNPKKELESTFLENLDCLLSEKDLVKKNKITIGLSVTLYKSQEKNSKYIERILNLLEKYNKIVTYVDLRLAMPIPDGEKYQITNHTEEVSYLVSNINAKFPNIFIKFHECSVTNCQIAPALYGKLLENPMVSNLNFGCHNNNSSATILPDMSYLPCPYTDFKYKTTKYKNCPNGDMAKFWNLNRMKKYNKSKSIICDCKNLICKEYGYCATIKANILERTNI